MRERRSTDGVGSPNSRQIVVLRAPCIRALEAVLTNRRYTMTKYIAKDGTEFDNAEDCQGYDDWQDELYQTAKDETRWIDNGCQWNAGY